MKREDSVSMKIEDPENIDMSDIKVKSGELLSLVAKIS